MLQRIGAIIAESGEEGESSVSRPTWAPDNIPLDKPSPARMYDHFLGGYHNFEIDRKAAEQATSIYPDFPLVMRVNRAFLRRAVRYLAGQGIKQFLDIGSGIPTVGNVHEVARQANPAARVVYVDSDPIAVAHSRAILGGTSNAAIVQADARQVAEALNHPEAQRLLDLSKPLAVLLVFVLHFITDDEEANRVVRELRDAVPSGSYFVISHGTYEGMPDEIAEPLRRLYSNTTDPVKPRLHADIARFFEGLEMVDPGLVYVPLWRPEGPEDLFVDEPERCISLAGVGRKP
jgi:hypothetical protein